MQTYRDLSRHGGQGRALPKLTISQSRTPKDHLKQQEVRLGQSRWQRPTCGLGDMQTGFVVGLDGARRATRAWADPTAPQGCTHCPGGTEVATSVPQCWCLWTYTSLLVVYTL